MEIDQVFREDEEAAEEEEGLKVQGRLKHSA